MRARRLIFPLLALAVALALWWSSRREPAANSPAAVASGARPVASSATPATADAVGLSMPERSAAGAPGAADDFPLAAPLNAPGSTLARDLDAVGQILDAWRTNFPRAGNPVGENHEITAALTGDNPIQVVLIPKNHRAINAQGELCDRWGTPFRFHQVSGERMEIRSAGPDRKFGTADDGFWSPGS